MQVSESPIGHIQSQATTGTASRLFFIDYWRASLIILVVLHHIALVYGAGAPFYYVEPPANDPLAYGLLLLFVLINQSWFMGAFFLISGYFTAGSFDRKGAAIFLKDRLLRLGVPLLVFMFVLNPISSIGIWEMPTALTHITTPLTWQQYPHLISPGALWFVVLLLIFDFAYAAWRRATKNRASRPVTDSSPKYHLLAAFIAVLALVSYLVRMVIPLGKYVSFFPTFSYLPQYISFFVLGIIASRHNWFRTIPKSMGVIGFIVAVMATVLLFPLAVSGHLLSLQTTAASSNLTGNGHWQSAVYATWDSTVAVAFSLSMIAFFRRFLNADGWFGRLLARNSYAVYIVHIPIIVLLALAMRGIHIENLAKFALAAAIIVPTCFAIAHLVRKIPLVSRIL
jgi:glucan biosynthesis protein C